APPVCGPGFPGRPIHSSVTQRTRPMIRSLFALVLAVLLGASAFAGDVEYALTGESTKITSVGTKPGGKHEGGFKKLTGNATVNDGKIDTLKIEVEIDMD